MEPLRDGKFALYAMRYTGKEWVGVLDALSVDECIKAIKDAGTQPTNFSPADSTPAGHAVLDGIMAKGTVIA